jgi:hypothetical protein
MSSTTFYNSQNLVGIGSVGIGTTNPTATLDIVDQNNGPIQISEYNDTDGAIIRARSAKGTLAAPTGVVADFPLTALRGFGYTSAAAFSGRTVGIELCAAETFTASATGSYIRFDTCASGGTTYSEKMRILGNGRVGIGTAIPAIGLHCYNSTNFTLLLDNGTNSSLFQQAAGSGGLYIRTGPGTTGGTNGLYLNSGGSLFGPGADIATSLGGSSNKWTTVYAQTATINTSDARQKTNITPSSLGLEFINKLNPVSYKWISGQGTLDDNGNNVSVRPGSRIFYGFLAQEVKKTLDDLAVPDFAGWTLDDVNNPDSAQGLRYTEFIAPMVKSIQELSAKNSDLESRLAALEAKLA